MTASSPVVAIIGGGFSGASVAWHLHEIVPDGLRVVIVEPHADIGRGLAYSSQDPSHRINIPAKRMNIGAGQETHFHDWLVAGNYAAADPEAKIDAEKLYPTRQAFGSYVKDQIESLGASIVHVQSRAIALERDGKGWRIRCANGETIEADIAVLAVCHTPPDTPFSLKALQSHPRFFADPWQADPLRSIAPDDSVLIVGTGLTMADTVATLDRLGHRGRILAVSRHGLRSRPHANNNEDVYGDFLQPPPPQTALELLRRVRATIRAAKNEGQPWQAVIDQVRYQGQDIWGALSTLERARLLRHLRTFWDVHRFRIAPQVHDVLERRIQQGTLAIRAASVRAQAQHDAKISVEFRARHSRDWTTQSFDAVVLATGPAHGTVFDHDPLLSQIRKAGLAGPDPLKLGIAVDGKGRAIGAENSANPLYIAGPLARGTFGELMGISDLARYANVIAGDIGNQIGSMRDNLQKQARI
ncbi:MAG: hydroxyacylglutathione hydrolase [Bradyrhizobiaceae bacterium]|nr:MAG: hydroxyacylglutathione hydrolase [Bradyrhizobiaceae bacterium]